MARPKKEKVQELYQILNNAGKPVRIKVGTTSSISTSRVGKIYQSKAAALSAIRKAMKTKHIEPKTRWDNGVFLYIEHKKVTDDEWMEEILKLKIRIFQPVSIEDVTFHLDKIR